MGSGASMYAVESGQTALTLLKKQQAEDQAAAAAENDAGADAAGAGGGATAGAAEEAEASVTRAEAEAFAVGHLGERLPSACLDGTVPFPTATPKALPCLELSRRRCAPCSPAFGHPRFAVCSPIDSLPLLVTLTLSLSLTPNTKHQTPQVS